MNIPKNISTCKPASTKLLNSVDIVSGNIIQHWWYSKILTTGCKADTMAIALLYELWFLCHSKGIDKLCNLHNYSLSGVQTA